MSVTNETGQAATPDGQRLKPKRYGRATWIILGSIVLFVLVFFVLPVEYRAIATGRIEPVGRYPIDNQSPWSAVVRDCFVEPNQFVRRGDRLIVLHSQELSEKLAKLRTDLQKARGDYAQGMRNFVSRDSSLSEAQVSGLTGSNEKNLKAIREMETELELLIEAERGLTKLAPADGIITDPKNLEALREKAYSHGDTILTVSDLDGKWQITFRLEPHRVPMARKVYEESLVTEQPIVSYFWFVSDPAKTYEGRVKYVGPRQEETEQGSEIKEVEMVVEFDTAQMANRLIAGYQGADVEGYIKCGKTSLVYYLFPGPVNGFRAWLKRYFG